MKLCIDCGHYRPHPHSDNPDTGLCASTKPIYSLVTGKQVQTFLFCSAYRIGPCGTEAKFFIPLQETTHD